MKVFFAKNWLTIFTALFISGTFFVHIVYAGTLSCSVTTAAACTGGTNKVILRMSGFSNAHAELPSQSTPAYASYVVCCGGVTNLSNSCSGSYTTVLKLFGTSNAHVQQSGSYSQSACISIPSGTAPTVAYVAGDQSCTPTYDDTLLSMSADSNAHVGNETAYNAAGNYKICATAAGAGTLTVDIVDAGGTSVPSPTMAIGARTFSFTYQTATGVFGVTDQKIRVNNTTANPQWTLSISASSGSGALWSNVGETKKYDFNDPTANAEDGSDSPDTVGGQMTINASGSTLGGTCSATDITKGSSTSFSEDVTDSIPLLTAGASADIGCYWDLTSVSVSQTIPASQGIDTSYTLNLLLTVTPGP